LSLTPRLSLPFPISSRPAPARGRRDDLPPVSTPGRVRYVAVSTAAPDPAFLLHRRVAKISVTDGIHRKPRGFSPWLGGFIRKGFSPSILLLAICLRAYNWGMKDKKIARTFRLSETALKLLLKMAERGGTTKTAILEALIRQAAKKPDTK